MSGAVVTGPLLERSEEIARIEAALTEARTGRGTVAVIEGPAGIGKTTLLDAARAAAVRDRMRTLRSRGTELERDFAFGVVRQLFEPVVADASASQRADLLQSAAGLAAARLGFRGAQAVAVEPAPGVDPSFGILHGLYWLCANLASTEPLCIVVDDLHLVDAPSLRYLAFLVTRIDELKVALIVATRPRESGTDAALLATVTAEPSAEVIRLLPLTQAAVAHVIGTALEEPPDPAFVRACMDATGGTPFLVHELVGALNEEDITPTEEASLHVQRIGAQSVARSINLRLRRLPDNAGRLARALAVLEQSDLLTASRLAQMQEDEAVEAAESLTGAGILESGLPLTFVHPIVRSGIYEEIVGVERAQAHRRAATLLAELPEANERVAQHLLLTEPAGDEWVVGRLVAAASAARRHGAPETEAHFLVRALAESPAPRDHHDLLTALGKAEVDAGIDGWDDHLQRAVDSAPNPKAAARSASALAQALNRAQRFAEAVEVLDRAALALAASDADLMLRLEAKALVIGMNDFVVSPRVFARRRAVRHSAREHPGPPPEVLGAAAFISILENEPAEEGAKLALLAEQGWAASAEYEPIEASISLFARTSLSLVLTERYAEVEPLLEASIEQARAAGDSGVLSIGLANRAWLALRRGNLSAAEADTVTALTATELPAPPMYRVLNRALLVETLVERGNLDEAERELGALGEDAERRFLIATVARFARGRLRIEQGRVAEALADFIALGEALSSVQVVSPSFLAWRSQAALAHLALGESDHARRQAEAELDLASTFGAARALGVAKRALGIVVGGEQGELLLREAIDAFERSGAELERARALADLGAMLRRGNHRTQARELLREALDRAHRIGARRLAERAETELRATGARPRRVVLTGLDALTASERRVAELASQDLTNREIAQMLFVTDRTVEGHLTSVFRKLDLDSRSGLSAVLANDVPVSA